MLAQDIIDGGEVIASHRTHPDIVRDGKRVMGLMLGFPAQARVEHIFTETSVAAIRDALTAWLDAPRVEARKTPTVVAERDGIRLLTTSSGEWGVADDESPSWLSCEAEARYEFREATGTVSCESCARFIDRDDAHVDADGIYGCADEDACSAAKEAP